MKKWAAIHLERKKKMQNELAKTQKNELAVTDGQKLQVQLLDELDKSSQQMGQEFTDYGKKCVINAIAGLVSFCKSNGTKIEELDPILLRLSLQNIGYTELNYAAIPSEIYFDIRKSEGGSVLTIKPQGAGVEMLVRKYGVGLKKDIGLRSAILIHEGDEFIMPQFNGIEITPPVYKPKLENQTKKVIAVMYPAIKIDNSVEYLIATREGIKPNIIAQIRQNTLYLKEFKVWNAKTNKSEIDNEKRQKFWDEVDAWAEGKTVDEMLADSKYAAYINPTYTSGGSREQMILRKMKNNALKNYPKNYDNAYIRNAVEGMYEDFDESLREKPAGKDVVATVEREITETSNEEPIPNFDVDEDGVVVKKDEPKETNQPKQEEPVPAEEAKEQEESDSDGANENPSSQNYEDLI